MSASGTLYLIDGSLYVFRAWHSITPNFLDHEGAPVNAVYGFTRFLCDFLEKTKPTHAVVAFDESLTSSFRNTIYPNYKANREMPPDELRRQFAYCKEIAHALGLCVLAHEHYEADDLIGSAVVGMRKHGFRSVVISADKDFGQLIELHDEQWDFPRDVRWNSDGVKQRLGVRPDQVVDFLALTGDAIDNIPGVPGIGAKTAAILLAHFGSLDELLKRVEEVPYLRMRSAAQIYLRLKEHREQALLSRMLSAIALDAPVPPHADGMTWSPPDLAAIEVLMEKLRFGPLTRSRMRGFAQA
jgi:5'-3' exonuclease